MASLWKFGTVDIYVEEQNRVRPIKRAELNVLDAVASTYHFFGAASRRNRLMGLVIGDANMITLDSDAINDTTRTLTSDQGSLGSFKIDGDIEADRIRHVGAFIDGVSYDVTTPIYRITLEVIPVV